jgi:hypothetical protein
MMMLLMMRMIPPAHPSLAVDAYADARADTVHAHVGHADARGALQSLVTPVTQMPYAGGGPQTPGRLHPYYQCGLCSLSLSPHVQEPLRGERAAPGSGLRSAALCSGPHASWPRGHRSARGRCRFGPLAAWPRSPADGPLPLGLRSSLLRRVGIHASRRNRVWGVVRSFTREMLMAAGHRATQGASCPPERTAPFLDGRG